MRNADLRPACLILDSREIGAPQPDPASPVHLPVSRLLALAERQPHQEALRHKRHGAWLAWSWAGLARQLERLGQVLQARGIGAGSLVAVSGQYAPNLLLFALAAAHRGAHVVPIPLNAKRTALAEWLTRNRPDIAFLGQRDQLGLWRGALDQAGRNAALIVDFHLPWGHPSGAAFGFAADLLGPAVHGAAPGRAPDALWIEESTDWTEGLAYLGGAMVSGRALAFPESRMAAARDRREMQPSVIALSPDRHAALLGELSARLPTGAAWPAQLTAAALAAGRAGRARWHHRRLLARLRRPLGLARLRALTVVGEAGPAAAGDLFAALGIASGDARAAGQITAPPQPELALA